MSRVHRVQFGKSLDTAYTFDVPEAGEAAQFSVAADSDFPAFFLTPANGDERLIAVGCPYGIGNWRGPVKVRLPFGFKLDDSPNEGLYKPILSFETHDKPAGAYSTARAPLTLAKRNITSTASAATSPVLVVPFQGRTRMTVLVYNGDGAETLTVVVKGRTYNDVGALGAEHTFTDTWGAVAASSFKAITVENECFHFITFQGIASATDVQTDYLVEVQ